MHLRISTLFLIPLLFLAACSGPSSPAPSAAAGPGATAGPSDNDLLRVGDVITIRISGVPPEDSGVYDVKINDQGEISMPLLTGAFHAAGLSTSQLKEQIENAYRTRKIYTNPNITIVPQLRYVNVNGEIRTPQRIPFTNDLSILRAIAACGGFTDYANKHNVRLLRGSQVIHFNAIAAMKNPGADIPLQAGDQIQVDRSIF